MNAKQIEVHEYYKNLHPEALILYHLPGQYMILGDDVIRAQKSISNLQIVEDDVAVMPDDVRAISELGASGAEIQIIQYRDGNGLLDLPNVHLLSVEKQLDY